MAAKKLSKAEQSRANKKTWAEMRAREKAARGAANAAKKAGASRSSAKAKRHHSPLPTCAAPSAGRKQTRAGKSTINKERFRKQREKEAQAAKTGSGSTRRRDVFSTNDEHKSYLRSSMWKARREEVHGRAKGKCEMCGERGSSVHHIRYSQPGTEHPSHLLYVCNDCHRQIHGTHR